jgi:nucleotide-binding universal stress UspA family protein
MNEANRNSSSEIRRILVAVDASPHSLARIETAAELAANLQAELIGIFVEDANLLRMAELPFAREISMFSPIVRRIELERLQWELRAQADRMRRVLASAAESRKVPWAFSKARGSVAAEVLAAASEADLIIVGKMTWAPAGARRLGSAVQMILRQGRGLTLVMHERTSWSLLPITVIFDGSDLSHKALHIAVRLVQIHGGRLNVMILASDRETARGKQAKVAEELSERKLAAEFRLLINPTLNTVAWLVQNMGSNPLVLPCSENILQGEELCSLIRDVDNPVFLVR